MHSTWSLHGWELVVERVPETRRQLLLLSWFIADGTSVQEFERKIMKQTAFPKKSRTPSKVELEERSARRNHASIVGYESAR